MRAFDHTKVPHPKVGLVLYPTTPVDLEIGCGVGLHPISYCRKHPERNLIALDRSRLRMSKMEQSMQAFDLPNLYPICEDADKFIAHEIKGQSLDNIFLYYPNPYPKQKQANKRWHQMPLMQCLHEKLQPNGRIHLATNKAFYAQEAKVYMVDTWQMSLQLDVSYKGELPFAPRTHFEKKYLARGETLFDLIFQKQR